MNVLPLFRALPALNADAEGDRFVAARHPDSRHAFMKGSREFERLSLVANGANREFVAAVPYEEVARAIGPFLDHIGDLLENPVADDVPVLLVVAAELVEVDEENRDFAALLQILDAPFAEPVAPGEAGQGIPGASHFAQQHVRGGDSSKSIAFEHGDKVEVFLPERLGQMPQRRRDVDDDVGSLHYVAHLQVGLFDAQERLGDDADEV